VGGGVGSGEVTESLKSGNEDELRRASALIESRLGLCWADGARLATPGRAAFLRNSLEVSISLGRGAATLYDLSSSGSECPEACFARLGRGEAGPATVLLRPTRAACTLSEIMSSAGRGLRACATAKGPACRGSQGAAILAIIKLDRTVTGRMFSLIFSRRCGSAEPNTMRCTLLYMRRHVLNECELWSEARS
jgi:hypothetical protein